MTGIGPASPLAAYLRSQLSALRPAPKLDPASTQRGGSAAGAAKPGGAAVGRGAAAGQATAASAANSEDLASRIARRVAVIDKGDPDRRRKAFRVFLESVMLDEWGPQLINDPGFQGLVDTVQAQMQANTALQGLMDEAADRLLGPPAG